jgi:hypothetical protein
VPKGQSDYTAGTGTLKGRTRVVLENGEWREDYSPRGMPGGAPDLVPTEIRVKQQQIISYANDRQAAGLYRKAKYNGIMIDASMDVEGVNEYLDGVNLTQVGREYLASISEISDKSGRHVFFFKSGRENYLNKKINDSGFFIAADDDVVVSWNGNRNSISVGEVSEIYGALRGVFESKGSIYNEIKVQEVLDEETDTRYIETKTSWDGLVIRKRIGFEYKNRSRLGEHIRFAKIINASLEKISSTKTGRKLLERIKESGVGNNFGFKERGGYKIYIESPDGDEEENTRCTGVLDDYLIDKIKSRSKIMYNPALTEARLRNGSGSARFLQEQRMFTPETTIFHELVHAVHNLYGERHTSTATSHLDLPWDPAEELSAVRLENLFRAELGLPPRETYSGNSLDQMEKMAKQGGYV